MINSTTIYEYSKISLANVCLDDQNYVTFKYNQQLYPDNNYSDITFLR